MKTIILLFLIMALQTRNSLQAQHVQYGLKVGLNTSNIWYEKSDPSEYKTGIHAGGLAHIHLSKRIGLQPELLFSNQGGKQTQDGTDYNLNLNYLNVPVLVQYMIGTGFRLQAGPQIGYLISAKRDKPAETDIKKNYKSADLSLAAGLGYVTGSGLGLDARWVFGFSDINNLSGNNFAANNVAQVGLFYLFNQE